MSTRDMNKIQSINGVNYHLISWFCVIGIQIQILRWWN